MQRILSTKSPREAAKMNAFTMVVLYFPLYLLVAGILVLSIHYFNILQMTTTGRPNLEGLLGMVIMQLPTGVKGLIMAGMLAAFMSTFSAVVNSGPAYIVNDIYRKYINPNATQKTYLRVSYISCASIVTIGLLIGLGVQNISTMFDLITGGLYAGFVVPNVLKWIWWRLNGWGYFASMVAGIVVSLLTILFWHSSHIVLSFPINMTVSLATAVIVSYLTAKQSLKTLQHFYSTTRPWGFWGPVKDKVMEVNSAFHPNKNLGLDAFNVIVGIVWQMSMIIMPIYLVLKEMGMFGMWAATWLACSVTLAFTWYKKLPGEDEKTNIINHNIDYAVDEEQPVTLA
jgi:Na+/proline symporter